MSEFSERLKELRGTESQASFAASLGLNRVQYAKYEGGTNTPSVDVLDRICRIHAVSADWLLGLREPGATAIASGNGAVAVAGRGNRVTVTKRTPGEAPSCAKCPYKKKLLRFEALLNK